MPQTLTSRIQGPWGHDGGCWVQASRGLKCKLLQGLTCVLHRTGQGASAGPAQHCFSAQEITQLLVLAGLGLALPVEIRDTSREGCKGGAQSTCFQPLSCVLSMPQMWGLGSLSPSQTADLETRLVGPPGKHKRRCSLCCSLSKSSTGWDTEGPAIF